MLLFWFILSGFSAAATTTIYSREILIYFPLYQTHTHTQQAQIIYSTELSIAINYFGSVAFITK